MTASHQRPPRIALNDAVSSMYVRYIIYCTMQCKKYSTNATQVLKIRHKWVYHLCTMYV